MKICMLSYSFYERDNRVRRYAEALVKRGDDIEVFAIGKNDTPKEEMISGVKVRRIQNRVVNEKRKIEYLFRLFLFLIKSFYHVSLNHIRSPYQLVHVHSVPDFEVFAVLLPKIMGSKIILDVHDIVPEFYTSKFNNGRVSAVTKALILVERWCCKFADHVIISNDIWKEVIINRSVNKSKCTTIINYPDTSIFKSDDKKDRGDSDFIAMYPGTLNYHQGVDIAIRAIAQVRNTIPNIKFQVYGTGPLLSKLQKIIQEMELQNNVILFGMVPLHEIAKKMVAADLGIVPKRAEGFGNEAFSTKILEFMALGVPVIASDTKIDRLYFNDSIIQFYRSGDESDLAEKIVTLYNDKQKRINMSQNAYKFAMENCWENKKELYFNIVDSLVKGLVDPVIEESEHVLP